jgi:hypothetical protein
MSGSFNVVRREPQPDAVGADRLGHGSDHLHDQAWAVRRAAAVDVLAPVDRHIQELVEQSLVSWSSTHPVPLGLARRVPIPGDEVGDFEHGARWRARRSL